MAMDLARPSGIRHSRKTDADVGDELVSIIHIEVYALKVDLGVVLIDHSDDFGKDRREGYPVVTQHKGSGVIRVKVAQRKRPDLAAGRTRYALAAVGHTPCDESSIVCPDCKHLCNVLSLGSRVDSGM